MATSLLTTLTTFKFYCSRPWSPNYSPLHTFKQLANLAIETPCHNDYSSAIDDETVTNLARALPKLNTLQLGSGPCGAVAGVTIEGLVGLACHCADLCTLRVHIQVNSLVQAGAEVAELRPGGETTLQTECSLTTLEVGSTPTPEGSDLTITLALFRIFPHIRTVKHVVHYNCR